MDALLRTARAECRRMTRRHAKSFYFASHVLPEQKRYDAYALYAFCRHVDDEIDLAADEAARHAAFRRLGELLDSAYAPKERAGECGWLKAFRETVARRKIPRGYFEDLLEGVRIDCGRVRIADWEELDIYCYRVASVVGLMMVHVLAEPRPELLEPARDLGTAMQLTNILRDMGEDWARDRLYLPLEEMNRFGLTEEDVASKRVDEKFRLMMQFQIGRAREFYRRAEPGIRGLPRDGSQLTVRLMSAIYGGILNEIERQDYQVYGGRAHVTFVGKIGIALRVLLKRVT